MYVRGADPVDASHGTSLESTDVCDVRRAGLPPYGLEPVAIAAQGGLTP